MIVKVPNPVLTAPSKPVTKIDRKILGLVAEMKRTLMVTDNPKGVGLAAPQIGIPLRIFITRPTENSAIEVFLNPEIIWESDETAPIQRPVDDSKPAKRKDKKLEGCLSIPEVWGYLRRAKKVRLRYMNLEGKIQENEYEGFMATILQHETDHLNGILFTHRVLEQNEKLYRIEDDKKGKEKLVEIEL